MTNLINGKEVLISLANGEEIILDESDEIHPYWWCTEDEIKQVVAALRSVFKTD